MVQQNIKHLGIQSTDIDNCMGIGTDGASPNIANAGLKGIMKKDSVGLLDVALSTPFRADNKERFQR